MPHAYSAQFYDYISSGSRASAKEFIPLLRAALEIDNVVDIGAGQGAWAAEWLAAGVNTVAAVDGHYVSEDTLLIPKQCFIAHDLSQPLDLERRFDLVQSLEVAEHIAADRAECFIDSLAAHGDIVLFSAAVPHQGGEHHVNEQPIEYWRRKFAARGYAAFDWLRPQLRDNDRVEPWYKFNAVLYANPAGQSRLSLDVLAARALDDAPLANCGSFAWRMRQGLVRLMPRGLVDFVAMTNAAHKARAFRHRAA